METIKTLHLTKRILASCQVNKVPFGQVHTAYCVKILQWVQFSPGYLLTQMGSKVDFSLWWMHFAIGNFIDNVSDRPFPCTLQIMKRFTLNRNVFFSITYC